MSDDRFIHGLIEAVPDAVVVTTAGREIVFVNAACEAMFQYARHDLVSKPLETLVPERLQAAHVELFRSFLDAPRARPMGSGRPLRGRRRDGSEIPIDVSLATVPSAGGVLYMAVVRDVTERTEAERHLREAEELFQLSFQHAPIGKALVDLTGRFVRVNDSLCRILGYTADELTALTFQQITHPEDLEIDLQLVGRLERGEIPSYQLQKRYVRKDGRVVHARLTGSVVRDRRGAARFYIAQIEDVTEESRAAERLRQSEREYRELIELAPDGVVVTSATGLILDVNSAFCKMAARGRSEILGESLDLLLGSIVGTDGARLPIEATTTLLADGRTLTFVRDVTDRKRATAAIQRTSESLARAQHAAHVGSFEWTPSTSTVERSAELCALFGIQRDLAASDPWSLMERIHPEDRAVVMDALRAAELSGLPYRLEHRVCTPDGVERRVLHQGEVERDEKGVARVIGTVLDITERKRIEEERERSLQQLEAVLEQCPVGIVLVRGAERQELQLNARAKLLFGGPVSTVDACLERLATPDRRRVADAEDHPVRRAFAGQRLDATELQIERPDAAPVPVRVSGAPFVTPHGMEQGVVVVFEDLTVSKQLERLLAERSSIIAHDLRQPLNAIALHADMIAHKLDASTRAVTAASLIRRTTRRLDRMVGDLMDLSQIEAGRIVLQRRSADLVKLVRLVLDSFDLVENAAPIRLEVGVSPVPVFVDADRMAQVVENLVSNARRYGAPGRPIDVELAIVGGDAILEVSNEGPGISEEDLPHLFGRFARSHDARRSGVKGTGLGLYITQELVAAHGGAVSAESVINGRTTFRVTLPLAPTTDG